MRAMLVDGPYDGWQDTLRDGEPPQLVTVDFCNECAMDHLHVVHGDWPDIVYLRHMDADGDELLVDGRVVYRFVDPDEDLDELLMQQRVLEGMTGAL